MKSQKRYLVTAFILFLGLSLTFFAKWQLEKITSSGLVHAEDKFENNIGRILDESGLQPDAIIGLRHKVSSEEESLRTSYKEAEDKSAMYKQLEEVGLFLIASILVHFIYHTTLKGD